MRLLLIAVALLLFAWPVQATTYIASPTGSGTTCSLASPCSLSTALAKPLTSDDIIYLRKSAGTSYKGKFEVRASGASGHPITIRTYPADLDWGTPGSWATLDGYLTTTLSAAITTTSQTLISLTDATNFFSGQYITIDDQADSASCETIQLITKVGNTFTNCARGVFGSTAQTHANGATVIIGGNQLYITGDYVEVYDIEITNTNPKRTSTVANTQSGPYLRGIGVYNLGDHNKIVNCYIHDNENGIFNGGAGVGPEYYGNVIFNSGYRAGSLGYNGHGFYLQHSSVTDTMYVKDNIELNSANLGAQEESQSGNAVNIWNEGNSWANNGRWQQISSGGQNVLIGANGGIADLITFKDNALFYAPGLNTTNFAPGYGSSTNGSIAVTGNRMSGSQNVNIGKWSPITFTGNFVTSQSNTGGGNTALVIFGAPVSFTPTLTWDSNTYSGSGGFYSDPQSGSQTFAQWKAARAWDINSTYTSGAPVANWIVVRPNVYTSGRCNVYIFNFLASSSVTTNISTCGLVSGQTFYTFAEEDPFGTSVLTGTYSGSAVSIPMNGTTVIQPIGWTDTTIASLRPAFQSFVIIPGPVTSAPDVPTGLTATRAFSTQGAPSNMLLNFVLPTSGSTATCAYSSDGVSYTDFATSSADATSMTVTGLVGTGLKYFRCRANKSGLSSANSNPVTKESAAQYCYNSVCTW